MSDGGRGGGLTCQGQWRSPPLISWGVSIGPRVFEKGRGLRTSWKSHRGREAAADNVEPSKDPPSPRHLLPAPKQKAFSPLDGAACCLLQFVLLSSLFLHH